MPVEELRTRLGDVGWVRVGQGVDWDSVAPMELVKYPTSLDPTDQPLMAVPLSNDSMNRPYPPRRTVLLLLKTRQAKPTRGAKSLLEE